MKRYTFGRISAGILICALLLIWPAANIAATGEDKVDRRLLRGLKGVSVYVLVRVTEQDSTGNLVGIDDFDANQNGIETNQIQADVELALRLAGIRVLPRPPANQKYFKQPTLNCFIMMMKTRVGYMSAIVSYLVVPPRHRKPAVKAWSADVGGIFVSAHELAIVRQKVKDVVSRFINEYLAANVR